MSYRYFVIDGPPGAGVNTMLARLHAEFGAALEVVHEPNGSSLGRALQEVMNDAAPELRAESSSSDLLSMASLRACLCNEVAAAEQSGRVPVLGGFDASYYARYVFGGDKRVEYDFWKLRHGVLQEFSCPLYILLDVSPEVGRLRRAREGRGGIDVRREIVYASYVRYGFAAFAHFVPHVTIDTHRSVDDVYRLVRRVLLQHVPSLAVCAV